MTQDKKTVLKLFFRLWVFIQAFFCLTATATPVAFYQSFAGNINFQVTGATLRTLPNNSGSSSDACQVVSPATIVTATLSGIPAGSTIQAAYLYWAGSGSTADLSVVFESTAVIADRSFSEFVGGGSPRDWFAGFEDVTALVQAKAGGPNGSYGFSGLTVDTGGNHCSIATVVAGWGLVVIYEHTLEPLRVLNLYDGLQNFHNSSLSLMPSNFRVPNSGIDGKLAVLTWEGDPDIPPPINPVNEDILFNGNPLTDAFNPANGQYNSTVNTIPTSSSHGVDFDVFDVTPYLSPGDTSATTLYSTGQDRVLLTLQLVSVTNTPVADLAISKSHTGNFVAGQQGVYTITVSNNGPNATSAGSTITVTDTLPAGLSYVSASGSGWNCSAAGQVVTCTRTGAVASGVSLPAISLTVNVSAAAAPSVNNVASVSSNTTTFDNQAGNNSVSDSTNVLVPNLSTSAKTALDLNGGDANPGDRLRYTITITESAGAAVSGVRVTDNIDTLLTNFTVTNNGGGTDNSTPGSGPLDITGLSVPANGSVNVVFEADIVGSASPGNSIANTAVINNPVTGANTNAVAPNVIVSSSSIPGSGTKPLYFYMATAAAPSTNTLQRLPPSSNSFSVNITPGSTYSTVLTPGFRSAMTLLTGNIPVQLWLDRRNPNGSGSRNLTVILDYFATGPGGSSGTIGSQTLNNILNTSQWQLITFNINLLAQVTLNPNTAIRFTLRNEASSPGDVLARTLLPNNASGTPSAIFLNAGTVINVDSVIAVDNVAYPGGTAQSSYLPGETVRIRAVVRDPFGSFDITGASIVILDPNTNVVVPSSLMTQVNDSGVATKTYEYIFSIPSAGPNGNWTARVIANEGTEGAITDLGIGTFLVGTPLISVMKLGSTFSDPVNNPSYPSSDPGANPKAIPGAIVEYRIIITNNGAGPADNNSVVITDALPPQTTLFFSNPVNPVQFVNGSPGSGLTFTFTNLSDATDDVDFSNNGGGTFITPTVDANGFDATVPAINFIRINPKGRLNGSVGSGNPSFSILFRGRVQ